MQHAVLTGHDCCGFTVYLQLSNKHHLQLTSPKPIYYPFLACIHLYCVFFPQITARTVTAVSWFLSDWFKIHIMLKSNHIGGGSVQYSNLQPNFFILQEHAL